MWRLYAIIAIEQTHFARSRETTLACHVTFYLGDGGRVEKRVCKTFLERDTVISGECSDEMI